MNDDKRIISIVKIVTNESNYFRIMLKRSISHSKLLNFFQKVLLN